MKHASSSLLLVLFAALFVSLQSYAQISVDIGRPRPDRGPRPDIRPQQQLPRDQVIREDINRSVRGYERLRLGDLLRLSWQEQSALEVLSLRVVAQSLMQGPAELELSARGQLLSSALLRRQLGEVAFNLPLGTRIAELELGSRSDVFLASVMVEVRSDWQQGPGPGPGPGPGRDPQVSPGSFLTLQLNQTIRGAAQIPLHELVRQQHRLSLSGAQIERVVVQGQPLNGRSASVQVELNRRPVSDVGYLSQGQRMLPLPVNSLEEVRSLSLLVNGDAQIFEIRIRVGQVRPERPEFPQSERFIVNQEVSPRFPLDLGHILRYDRRFIRSLTIHARSLRQAQAQLSLIALNGEQQGVIFVGPNSVRVSVVLRRPMIAQELRLESAAPILIEMLEVEF